jgi:hypothetical protein
MKQERYLLRIVFKIMHSLNNMHAHILKMQFPKSGRRFEAKLDPAEGGVLGVEKRPKTRLKTGCVIDFGNVIACGLFLGSLKASRIVSAMQVPQRV